LASIVGDCGVLNSP